MRIEDYFDDNDVFAEDKKFILKKLSENDKEDFMKLQMDVSSIKKAYEINDFYEFSWSSFLHDKDLNLSLFSKDTGVYLGRLMLKNLSADKQEIGIDIVEDYRRKGRGSAAVCLLMKHAKEVSGADWFEIRIYSDNIASINMFKKLGAVEADREDSEFIKIMKVMEKSLRKDEIERSKRKYSDLFGREEGRKILLFNLKALD